jgi:Ca2+-binding EF-hand superfamily protein
MSDRSVEEIREVFNKYDTDHSGFIDSSELKKICELLNVHAESPDVESVMEYADANRDGKVSFDEFSKLLTG